MASAHAASKDRSKSATRKQEEDLDWEDSASEGEDTPAAPESNIVRDVATAPVPRATGTSEVADRSHSAPQPLHQSADKIVAPNHNDRASASNQDEPPTPTISLSESSEKGTSESAPPTEPDAEERAAEREKQERKDKERKTSVRQTRSMDDFKKFSTRQPLTRFTARVDPPSPAPAAAPEPARALNWSQALSVTTATAEQPQRSPRESHTQPSSPMSGSPAPERSKIRALFSSMVIGFKGAEAAASGSESARVSSVFGVALDTLAHWHHSDVPPAITTLLTTLHLHLEVEGIFRLSAAAGDVAQLRAAMDKGSLDTLSAASAHTLAGVLTTFLNELPEPPITFALYNDALSAVALPNGASRTTALSTLMARLSRPHLALVRLLVNLWQATDRLSATNKMGAINLGVVFGPLVLRPRKETLDMRRILLQNTFVESLISTPSEELFRK